MPAEVVPFYELVLDAGTSAPWIVMVHGVSQDRRVFSAQVRDFSEAYRLMLIDLPGHGRSGALLAPMDLAFRRHSRGGSRRRNLPISFSGAASGAGADSCLQPGIPIYLRRCCWRDRSSPDAACLPSAKR